MVPRGSSLPHKPRRANPPNKAPPGVVTETTARNHRLRPASPHPPPRSQPEVVILPKAPDAKERSW